MNREHQPCPLIVLGLNVWMGTAEDDRGALVTADAGGVYAPPPRLRLITDY